MTTSLYYNPFVPAFSNIGVPIAEAYLYFYYTSTSTLAPIFSDAAGLVPLTNPVQANLAGKYPAIYMQDGVTYRVHQTDSLGVTLGDDIDPYYPGTVSVASDPTLRGDVDALSVPTIAALRVVPYGALTNNRSAFVEGYYTQGDGGGGPFYWSSASTATDDGGSVIKPTSNAGAGRWLRIVTGPIDVKWFGAKGDNSTDNSTALAAWLASAAVYGALYISDGSYAYSTPLVYTENPAGNWRNGDKTISITGAGANCTSLYYTGTGASHALRINGVFPVANNFTCSGFTLRRADGSPASVATGVGLYIKDMLSFVISDIKGFRHGTGLYMEGCLVGRVENSALIYNNIGLWAELGTASSTPNVVTVANVDFAGCYTRGIKVFNGTGFVVDTCTFDGIGSTDTNGIGIEASGLGGAGGVGLVLAGSNYFEGIGGTGIYITHTQVCNYSLKNAVFNRFGGTTRKMTGIVFDPAGLSAGGPAATVGIGGCAFNAYSGWAADPLYPPMLIGFGAGTYDALTVLDEGACYQLSTEIPSYSIAVKHLSASQRAAAQTRFAGAAATISNAYNVSGIVRNSAGDYTFTFKRPPGTITGVSFTAVNTDCVAKVTAETATTVRIVTHIAGVATDTDGFLTVFGTAV